MRKSLFVLFALLISLQFSAVQAFANTAAPVKTEFHALKKKNRGYKKPKKKKFLGIFKRKSSCDCPKH